jgi:hypothetical protein
MSISKKIFTCILTFLVFNQVVFAQDSLAIGSDEITDIVNRVASIMTDKYVDPETGRKMANHIVSRHEKGAYGKHTDIESFCSALTSDLRSISDDKHLFVFHSPEEKREVAARLNLLPIDEVEEIERHYYESERRENFGFQKVEILDGNIGYLKLNYFSSIKGTETAISAMAFLSNADAIIIDLRENGGGEGISFLSTYFFPPGEVELSGAYFRESASVKRSWTLPYVPGKLLPNVDLYILTSSRTFSAAEDFTYSLQQLKRAKVVGERTKGGAHPVDVLIVKNDILTQVSIGRSINPISMTNWEGVGIQPNVMVPAEDAQTTAYLLALNSLLDESTDEQRSEELISLIRKKE